MKRSLNLFPIVLLAATSAVACSQANFGLGEESDAESDSVTTETTESDTVEADTLVSKDSGTETPDTAVPDTFADSAAETDSDAIAPDTIAPDASPTDADAIVSPCEGKGIPTGQLGAVYFSPALKDRPNGFLAYAGAADGSSWQDPIPGCSSSAVDIPYLVCVLGTASKYRFLIGVSLAAGGALEPLRPFTFATGTFFPYGKIIVCKNGDVLGACSGSGCTGKLSQDGSTTKLVVAP